MSRFRSSISAVVVLVLLLAGCARLPQRQVPVDAAPATAGSEAPSIRVLTSPGDAALDALIAAFYAKYPNYRIDKVTVPTGGTAADTVKYRISEGEADVIATSLPGVNVPEMAKAGQLVALDPYIKRSKFDLTPLGAVANQMRVDGTLYDLPYGALPVAVLYNQDMFQKAGLPLPREGWTWDQFREAARTLTQGDGDSKVWGVTSYMPDALVRIWLLQRTAGNASLVPDEKTLREALPFFTTLLFTDKATPPLATGGTSVNSGLLFVQGKSAMCVDLLLNLTAISQRAKFNWNVAPMPAVPGGAGAQLVTPITYAIPATSPNPEGAWTFLHFAAGPEGAAAVAKAGQFPMYNTAEVRTAWLNRQPAPPAGTETFFTTNWQMTPRGADSTTQKYWNALVTLFTQALSGQRPWEDALRDYLLQADRIKLETR